MHHKACDIVLVIDASGSMQNCFDQLRRHLQTALLGALSQGPIAEINWALLMASAGRGDDGGVGYRMQTLLPDDRGMGLLDLLYKTNDQAAARSQLFTRDVRRVVDCLESASVEGDEDMLVALDFALDFPFGPPSTTRRVIAMFSDEPFETGVEEADQGYVQKLAEGAEKVRQKMMARKVLTWITAPSGPTLASFDQVPELRIEPVLAESDGLRSTDFAKLLSMMGKTISGASRQMTGEAPYQRAIFGQDAWVRGGGSGFHGR